MRQILYQLLNFIGIIITEIFVFMVNIYRWAISPLLPNTCRYTPTCSAYAIEAFKTWGPLKGLWLTIKRLSSCHPWGGCGHDPVPKKHEK